MATRGRSLWRRTSAAPARATAPAIIHAAVARREREKLPFDIDKMFRRIREAIKPYKKAAMFGWRTCTCIG